MLMNNTIFDYETEINRTFFFFFFFYHIYVSRLAGTSSVREMKSLFPKGNNSIKVK